MVAPRRSAPPASEPSHGERDGASGAAAEQPEERSSEVAIAAARNEGEVLLVHPGGPFWRNKDEHAWSVPKGLVDPDEDAEAAARREFEEELGQPLPEGDLIELGTFEQNRRKTVRVWMLDGDLDVSAVESNEFEMEWPPKSGRMQSFPEVDRAEWFPLEVARAKIHKGQVPILDALAERL